ncbi:hypothetical protein CL616_04210 [archaeon]|jgi:hypothetical protein|nr:hypothetical protein [archaeon]MAG78541.1 hypothetical protein [archaeon]|tara:strand:+ start:2687 stop:2866 length:180 start_codon:yes stop_codon:yes gene_type:complete
MIFNRDMVVILSEDKMVMVKDDVDYVGVEECNGEILDGIVKELNLGRLGYYKMEGSDDE